MFPSIVLMEQPEIHLHPSVQSGLADVMLAVAQRGAAITTELEKAGVPVVIENR